jgi:mannosyltransferase
MPSLRAQREDGEARRIDSAAPAGTGYPPCTANHARGPWLENIRGAGTRECRIVRVRSPQGYCVAPMQRWGPYALPGIIAVAAVVRFATLDGQSFDHDEAVTAARVLHPSLFDTLSVVAHGERSPPLYYVLAWGWSRVFGTSEVGLRSLSALFGTLTVPVAYLAARELVSRRLIALMAAAFVALNPYLIWYSLEARSYALMVLFTAVALLFFARALNRPDPRSLAMWAVASALALCSHYFAAFLIVPQAVWLVLANTHRRETILAVTAVLAVGVALIPLAVTQEGGGRRNGFTAIPLASRVGELGLNFVASEEPAPFAGSGKIDAVQGIAAVGGALLLLTALGLVVTRASPEEMSAAAVVGALGSAAIAVPVLLAVVGIDFINPRNLIGALVPLLILLAVGFGARGSGHLGWIAGLAACLLFSGVLVAVNVSAQMQRPDWRGAAQALASSGNARVFVVPRNGDDPLGYYLGAQKPRHRGPTRIRTREIEALSTNYLVKRPPAPFRLVHKEGLAPYFLLWVYRAPHPVAIRPRDLAGSKLLSERSSVLVRDGS